ncbi:MAG TPA: isoprenylcysteine carboxylmethyltransferase family protein [Candidatus Acidoferrales bacterium]|nr:isoprenylcysteine carboxylmethyltransferase family protein [Candidatus Acidoferrales bacterium]
MSQSNAQSSTGWRTIIFKNRGLLLVPVALVLIIFGRPTLVSAIAGVAIAALGELLRIWAVGYSGATTRANVVTAPALVTAGPYAYVRNPLYVGNTVIAVGFWFAFSGGLNILQSAAMLAFVVLMVAGVYATIIPLEEAYLVESFGAPYREYLERVPRIFPTHRLPAGSKRLGTWRADVIFQAEIITLLFFGLMVAALLAKLYMVGKPAP